MWAQFEGWVDRRFDSHPQIRPAERFPERHAVSLPQPEGWVLAFDLWGDHVATRQLGARNILGGTGYLEYEKQPTKARKQWLLGRIAAKDAVRYTLWAGGTEEVFPAELTVANGSTGRPRVYGRPGKSFGDFDVSLAHCAEAGVAITRPLGPDATLESPGVGIDIAEVTEHPESTLAFALSAAERALLAETAAATGDGRWVWFTRFWTAKEAVAKAEGTGLDGNPQRFTVVAATPAAMTVEVGGRRYRVEHREVENPKELTPRRYVVGWTWGPQPTGARPPWVTNGPDHEPTRGTPDAIRQQGPDNGGHLA